MNKKLTHGSILTSRETLTYLKKSGYLVDIISSSKMGISSFSRWRNKTIFVENQTD